MTHFLERLYIYKELFSSTAEGFRQLYKAVADIFRKIQNDITNRNSWINYGEKYRVLTQYLTITNRLPDFKKREISLEKFLPRN